MTRDPTWIRYDGDLGRVVLTVHVQPNAPKTEIAGLHGDALKIRIAAPAADNRANAALIEFLCDAFKIPRSNVALLGGMKSRRKVVAVAGGSNLFTAIREAAMRA